MTKVQSSRTVYEGKWRVRVDMLELGNGRTLEKAVVVHPGSVVVVAAEAAAEGGYEVWMLRQFRHSLGRVILEVPAGTREEGEAWLDCARRELREETGFAAEEWLALGEVWPAPGVSDERMAIFLARNLRPDPLPADDDEEIEVVRMPLVELVGMALDGRLEDAKSVVALLRADRTLNLPEIDP